MRFCSFTFWHLIWNQISSERGHLMLYWWTSKQLSLGSGKLRHSNISLFSVILQNPLSVNWSTCRLTDTENNCHLKTLQILVLMISDWFRSDTENKISKKEKNTCMYSSCFGAHNTGFTIRWYSVWICHRMTDRQSARGQSSYNPEVHGREELLLLWLPASLASWPDTIERHGEGGGRLQCLLRPI